MFKKEYVLFKNDYSTQIVYNKVIKVKKLNRNVNQVVLKLELFDNLTQKYKKELKLCSVDFSNHLPTINIFFEEEGEK